MVNRLSTAICDHGRQSNNSVQRFIVVSCCVLLYVVVCRFVLLCVGVCLLVCKFILLCVVVCCCV